VTQDRSVERCARSV